MNRLPLVSVFMPVYNQEKFIAQSIESVLTQSFDDWELIIVDDCSTDRTYEIVKNYEEKSSGKIKASQNNINLGVTPNCNEVLSRCKGHFIAYTAGDDIFLKDKLAKQVQMMRENPGCILSYHDIEVFDSKTGEGIRNWNSGSGGRKPIVGKTIEVARKVVEQGTAFMAALSVMVVRSSIPSKGYDLRIPVASDWLMWIEILVGNEGDVIYLEGVHAKYRKHGNSITANPDKYREDNYLTLAICESRYPKLIDSIRKNRAYVYYAKAVSIIQKKGDVRIARSLLLNSFKLNIFKYKIFYWYLKSFVD